jgi:hypothetical protein
MIFHPLNISEPMIELTFYVDSFSDQSVLAACLIHRFLMAMQVDEKKFV